jgi:phage shock protein C
MLDAIRHDLAARGIYRTRQERILGGVCAGLGRRFGELSPWTSRLVFLLVLIVLPGSSLLIYPLLWIAMPEESTWYASRPGEPGQGS